MHKTNRFKINVSDRNMTYSPKDLSDEWCVVWTNDDFDDCSVGSVDGKCYSGYICPTDSEPFEFDYENLSVTENSCPDRPKMTEEQYNELLDDIDDYIANLSTDSCVDSSNNSKRQNNGTIEEYAIAINDCRDIFINKLHEYGASWHIMKPASITDQIYIRYVRLSECLDGNQRKDKDFFLSEFRAIVNYGIIALIQLQKGYGRDRLLSEDAIRLFDENAQRACDLMMSKNSEYGDAWKNMRMCSFIDYIGMKILRLMELENSSDSDIEELRQNYYDIINYSAFVLIRLR